MTFALISMVNSGMKQKCVAETFNISRSTISKIIKKEKSKNKVAVKKKGPKFKLIATALRILGRTLVKNNVKPIQSTVPELREDYGYKLSAHTVRRFVYSIGLRNLKQSQNNSSVRDM